MKAEEIDKLLEGGLVRLIAEVAEDVLAISTNPNVVIEPSMWLHQADWLKENSKCFVCAAGAFVLRRAPNVTSLLGPSPTRWEVAEKAVEGGTEDDSKRMAELMLIISRAMLDCVTSADIKFNHMASGLKYTVASEEDLEAIKRLGWAFIVASKERGNFDRSSFRRALDTYRKDTGVV